MQSNDTILIIDDVPSNIEILGSCLKELYNIKVASSGARALEIILLDPMPDLILLDVEMPEMDGFEVLRQLKSSSRTKNIPVIFVTGNDDIKNEERGLINGAVDYITKPISPIIVKARVKTHLTLKYQRDQLIFRASHDQLTQLYNRHKLVEEGERFFSKSTRYNENFCVAMIDIDNFKTINDTYGHLVGDKVLKSVATLLRKNIRTEDVIARYGGEEFIILFDSCNIEDAIYKADMLRLRINSLNPDGITVTASFGVASLRDMHTTFEHMLKDADEALYEAKESGRNRVVVFDTASAELSHL